MHHSDGNHNNNLERDGSASAKEVSENWGVVTAWMNWSDSMMQCNVRAND